MADHNHRNTHSRDCSGPAPGWTAEYRLPPCASAPQRAAAQCSSSSCSPAATPAASNNRLASRASTALRSEGLIFRSLTESSAMLSWCGTVDDWAGAGRFRILFPLDDSVIVPRASSETALVEQMMKLEQRRYCHTRRVDHCHTGAGDRIQH